MAFTPSLVGAATGTNVSSLSISANGAVQAGGRIYAVVGINKDGFTDLTDAAGNVYDQAAGSQVNGLGAFLMRVEGNLRLANNALITLTNSSPFSARMGVISVAGLTSGVLMGSSNGDGTDAAPLVAIDADASNWLLGVVVVAGPSADGFTQDPNFTNPGSFNTQSTPTISVYAGYRQAPTAGHYLYRPTLGAARNWAAMMISIFP